MKRLYTRIIVELKILSVTEVFVAVLCNIRHRYNILGRFETYPINLNYIKKICIVLDIYLFATRRRSHVICTYVPVSGGILYC